MSEDFLPIAAFLVQGMSPINSSSHVPPFLFQSVEEELCLSGYYTAVKPADYPSGFGEESGFRSLKHAANAMYQNMKLRIGATTLHIQNEHGKQLEALAFIYTGNTRQEVFTGKASAQTASSVSYVTLTEEGIVSACYLHPSVPMHTFAVISFYPPSQPGRGGHPYQKDPMRVRDIVKSTAKEILPEVDSQSIETVGSLAMLAKKIYLTSSNP